MLKWRIALEGGCSKEERLLILVYLTARLGTNICPDTENFVVLEIIQKMNYLILGVILPRVEVYRLEGIVAHLLKLFTI